MGSAVTDSRGSKAGLRLEALRGVGYSISQGTIRVRILGLILEVSLVQSEGWLSHGSE